jgi:hypothetical protein
MHTTLPIDRCRGAALRRALTGLTLLSTAACETPTRPGDATTFSAEVTGAHSAKLTGTANVNGREDWTRQLVATVTPPSGAPVTAIALLASDLSRSISLANVGASVAAGTYALRGGYRPDTDQPGPALWLGGYSVRRADNSTQHFLADSGTITITATSPRVTGTFVLHASRWTVMPPVSTLKVGQVLRDLESGVSPIRIEGSFQATPVQATVRAVRP